MSCLPTDRQSGISKGNRVHRGCRGRQKGKKMSKYQEKNCPVTQTLSYNSTMMTNLALINCQSACNKADVIKDHLIDHDIDLQRHGSELNMTKEPQILPRLATNWSTPLVQAAKGVVLHYCINLDLCCLF